MTQIIFSNIILKGENTLKLFFYFVKIKKLKNIKIVTGKKPNTFDLWKKLYFIYKKKYFNLICL